MNSFNVVIDPFQPAYHLYCGIMYKQDNQLLVYVWILAKNCLQYTLLNQPFIE